MDFTVVQKLLTTWANNNVFSNLILIAICVYYFNKYENKKAEEQYLRDEENRRYHESMLEVIITLKHSLQKNWKDTNISISLSREAHRRLDEKFKENYLKQIDTIFHIKAGENDEDIK